MSTTSSVQRSATGSEYQASQEWRNSMEARYSSFEGGGRPLAASTLGSNTSTWSRRGEVSDTANEVLMDARLSKHGKEKQLYQNATLRLSTASVGSTDSKVQDLAERLRSASGAPRMTFTAQDGSLPPTHGGTAPGNGGAGSRYSYGFSYNGMSNDIMHDVRAAMALPPDAVFPDPIDLSSISLANGPVPRKGTLTTDPGYGSLSIISNMSVAESEDLALPPQEAEWEGYLLKKSEWFRKMERYYFVLRGKTLMRFRDHNHVMSARVGSPRNAHELTKFALDTYIISSVKDEIPNKSTDPGFIVGYGKAKNIHLVASSPVEKMVWMRIMLEAMAASPDIPVQPLDIDEFYAMLVVLYTAHAGEWRTEGDMSVTLPPPSEQVITRFFCLLDPDVLLTSNYPPSVPFHGRFSGREGFLRYWAIFSDYVKWSGFKVEGIQVDRGVAVASGREQLGNKNDDRKFTQNWVHKFDFGLDGRITRIEINGDVVAASAVFKAPGAATTLRLPTEFEEIKIGAGVLTVKVNRAQALRSKKLGSAKEAKVVLTIPASELHKEDKQVATDVPTTADEEGSNIVWNQELSLRFGGARIRTSYFLLVEVIDPGSEARAKQLYGAAQINLASYFKGSKPVEAWHTLSNSKGDFCGQIELSIVAELDDPSTLSQSTIEKTSSSSSSSRVSGTSEKAKKYRNLLHWKRSARRLDKELQETQRSSHDDGKRGGDLRRGWSSISLTSSSSIGSDLKNLLGHKDDKQRNSVEDDGAEIDEDGITRTYTVCGAPFVIPRHYELVKVCGRGAYGVVVAATNVIEGTTVAIKKNVDCVWHPHELKQALRELKLMRYLNHENILGLKDLLPPKEYKDFKDIYMVIDLMEMDLHRVIYSREVLADDHIRFFLYQMLAGLDHMHKCGILHRDLKPGNLLVNSNCELKICDFGLARVKETEDLGMTEYVVTRWYRAPELLLGCVYDEGVDIWAAGCIFAEMIGRKPLFPGRSYVHQLQLIMNVLGVPEDLSFRENPQAENLRGRQLLSKTPSTLGVELESLFPNANPEAVDLLWKMLTFDPTKRITIQEAFQHSYFAPIHDPNNTPPVVSKVDPASLDFSKMSHLELKREIVNEIVRFHPHEMEKAQSFLQAVEEEDEKLPPGWYKRESRKEPGRFYYCNPKRGISTWVKPTEAS